MPSFRALGDMSTTFMLSRQTYALKSEVQQASQELGSGQRADLSAALRGDFRALASIERGLQLAQAERITIAEAQGVTGAAQLALGVVQDQTSRIAGVLLAVPDAPTLPTLERAGAEARQALDALVGALNLPYADRAVFAGDATDGRALAAAETMLADLELAIAGATTAADVANAVEAWFDTPGTGFDTIGYLGSDTGLAPFRLGGGERADFSARADDPALRETMKGFAMAALLEGNAFTGTITERLELSRTAAVKLLNAQDRVTDLQATIGNAEASIARAEVRSGTERAALEIARGGLIGADPFEAATRLETAQTQLETLFALTARVSRMTLVDFLR